MRIKSNFQLKKITSTRVGGPARYYVEVGNESELLGALKWAARRRFRNDGRIILGAPLRSRHGGCKLRRIVIGDGTNIIPHDGGFNGLVIRNKIEKFEVRERRVPRGPRLFSGKSEVRLGSGNNLLGSIRRLNRLGLGGMEKMAGIPGTIGGAIYGCAGAYGQEIKDRLVRARVWNGTKFLWLTNERCRFRYRDSIFKRHDDWIITEVVFSLQKTDPKLLQKTSAEIIKTREQKYPPGLRCPGSFFKNIVVKSIKPVVVRKKLLAQIERDKIKYGKIPAAYLLERIGAKGMRLGGVAIADYHANLIYNRSGGTAKDIRGLASDLKRKVRQKFGIILEEEVRYIMGNLSKFNSDKLSTVNGG